MNSGKILAVCVSVSQGTPKKDIGQVRLIKGRGLDGDAHATGGLRQVSLLAKEKVDEFCQIKGLVSLPPGIFAENLLTEGILLSELKQGDLLKIGSQALLRVSQIGKPCHSGCVIFQKVGDCLMPHEGIFAEVIQSGWVKRGDTIYLENG